MKKEKGHVLYMFLFTVILLAGAGITWYMQKENILVGQVIRPYTLALVLWYFLVYGKALHGMKGLPPAFGPVSCISCLVMVICLVFSFIMPVYHLWIFAAVILAVGIHFQTGLGALFLYDFLYCSFHEKNLYEFVTFFLLGMLLCLIGKYLKGIKGIISGIFIVIPFHIAMYLHMHTYLIDVLKSEEAMYSIGVTVVLFVLTCLFRIFVAPEDIRRMSGIGRKKIQEETEEEKKAAYAEILYEEYPLLQELKEASEEMYLHAKIVSRASFDGAVAIGSDATAAEALGMYHEIGSIIGNAYVREGAILTRKYHFPKELIHNLQQLDAKQGMVQSKAATIVMLADSIVSTIDYVKKTAASSVETVDKLVDRVFEVREEEGILQQSDLTMKEYFELKQYYISYFQSQI